MECGRRGGRGRGGGQRERGQDPTEVDGCGGWVPSPRVREALLPVLHPPRHYPRLGLTCLLLRAAHHTDPPVLVVLAAGRICQGLAHGAHLSHQQQLRGLTEELLHQCGRGHHKSLAVCTQEAVHHHRGLGMGWMDLHPAGLQEGLGVPRAYPQRHQQHGQQQAAGSAVLVLYGVVHRAPADAAVDLNHPDLSGVRIVLQLGVEHPAAGGLLPHEGQHAAVGAVHELLLDFRGLLAGQHLLNLRHPRHHVVHNVGPQQLPLPIYHVHVDLLPAQVFLQKEGPAADEVVRELGKVRHNVGLAVYLRDSDGGRTPDGLQNCREGHVASRREVTAGQPVQRRGYHPKPHTRCPRALH
eukprot:RCo028938